MAEQRRRRPRIRQPRRQDRGCGRRLRGRPPEERVIHDQCGGKGPPCEHHHRWKGCDDRQLHTPALGDAARNRDGQHRYEQQTFVATQGGPAECNRHQDQRCGAAVLPPLHEEVQRQCAEESEHALAHAVGAHVHGDRADGEGPDDQRQSGPREIHQLADAGDQHHEQPCEQCRRERAGKLSVTEELGDEDERNTCHRGERHPVEAHRCEVRVPRQHHLLGVQRSVHRVADGVVADVDQPPTQHRALHEREGPDQPRPSRTLLSNVGLRHHRPSCVCIDVGCASAAGGWPCWRDNPCWVFSQ